VTGASVPWNIQSNHATSSVVPSMPGEPVPVMEFSQVVVSPNEVPSEKFSVPESTAATTVPATCLNERVGTVAGVPFADCFPAHTRVVGRC
jgi:hypothetical protein